MKIVTMSTLGTGRLVANLLASCQILGIDSDVDLYCDRAFAPYANNFRTKLGMNVAVHERRTLDAPSKAADWGSMPFLSLMRGKLDLLVEVSHPNTFVPFLYLDADTVFLNRLPTALPNFIAFQSDARDFEPASLQTAEACTGCIWCPTPARSIWLLAQEWIRVNQRFWHPAPNVHYFDDQTAVNQVLTALHRPFELLDPSLWLNGARAFDPPRNPDVAPILVHANWRVGARRKEAELRSRGWWFASDESLTMCGL